MKLVKECLMKIMECFKNKTNNDEIDKIFQMKYDRPEELKDD